MKAVKVLTGTIVLVAVLGIGGCVYIRDMERELNAFMADPGIVTPDLGRIGNGTWTGAWKSGPISANVEVSVADHSITGARILRHASGKGKPAEVIVRSVVEQQSVEVETVTGATYSSTVILKAAQLALEQGLEESGR